MPTIKMKTKTKVKAATIWINAKCSDMCVATLLDKDGNEIFENDGYVPSFMPEEHYGDYVQLHIDLATGKIINWTPPDASDIQDWIKSLEPED